MRTVALGTLCLAMGAAALAAEEPPPAGQPGVPGFIESLVQAQLIAEHTAVPPGGTTRVAVVLDLKPGWHVYAPESGDAGLPTTVRWQQLDGVAFGAIQWPAPAQFVDPGEIQTFGYEGQVVLPSQLDVAEGVEPGELTIEATVTWLACREICIPGNATPALVLPVQPGPQRASAHAYHFVPTEEEG